MEVYPLCPACTSAMESLDHILFSCSYTRQCWQLSQYILKSVTGATFFQSLVDAFADMTLQELQFLCWVAFSFFQALLGSFEYMVLQEFSGLESKIKIIYIENRRLYMIY